jgi:hypothetical protein
MILLTRHCRLFKSMADAAKPEPAAAAAANDPLLLWASRHRRRAALDGAWKVEISEKTSRRLTIRSITSWHWHDETAREPLPRAMRTPMPSYQPTHTTTARSAPAAKQQEPAARSAHRRQRSFERSAAHHRQLARQRLRAVLRTVLLSVRLYLDLRRMRGTRCGASRGSQTKSLATTRTTYDPDFIVYLRTDLAILADKAEATTIAAVALSAAIILQGLLQHII